MAKKLGIYVHLPFCRSKCAYCDFYSKAGGVSTPKEVQADMDLYQKALLAHFKSTSSSASGLSVDSIYFGGGTPSYYGATRVDVLLRHIRKFFRVERDAEITMEGNPDSIDSKSMALLRRSGVNRISLGMQSANATELLAIGRPHSPETTRDAVSILKSHKIKNISLDLMYGLPQQTFDTWMTTVEEAIALEPQHLSCYGLKVEEGTPLFQRVEQGEELPSEDLQAECYLWTVERLKEAGFYQYEISNFAKEGCYSRHNMGYWVGKPYLGFGASASSDFGGYRYTFVSEVADYCHCVLEGGSGIFQSNELVTSKERGDEFIFLRLRTQEGISSREYEKATQLPFAPLESLFQRFQQEGWAESWKPQCWRFTPQGYLRSNLLLGALLDAQEEEKVPISPEQKPPAPPLLQNLEDPVEEESKEKTGIILQESEDGQFFF